MTATSEFFKSFNKKKKQNATVHQATLSENNHSYVFFRIKYFLIRNTLNIALHALEFFLILHFLDSHYAHLIIGIRILSFIITGFWWGILEKMRSQIRYLYLEKDTTNIGKIISHWTVITVITSILFCLLAAFLTISFTNSNTPLSGFMYFYMIMILLQTAFRLIALTIHSGIFSIRRVYRPFFAVIASPLSGIMSLLLLWPISTQYCLPLATLIQASLSIGITLYYSLQMLRFNNITIDFKIQSQAFIKTCKTILSRSALLIGISSLFIHIEGILTFFFIYLGSSTLNTNNLIFYLLAPIIGASVMWTKIFYFDFKKNHYPWLINLNKKLEISIEKVSILISLFLLLASHLLFTLFNIEWSIISYIILFGMIHSTSMLCTQQIICFSHNRHALICITGSIVVSAIIYSIIQSSSIHQALLLICIIQYTLYLIMKKYKLHSREILDNQYPEPVPFYFWLKQVATTPPKQIIFYQFDKGIQLKEFQSGHFKLAQFHQKHNFTCAINKTTLLTAIYEDLDLFQNHSIYENLIHCPFIKISKTRNTSSANHIISTVSRLSNTPTVRNLPTNDNELIKEFTTKFPNGIVIDLEHQRNINNSSITKKEWGSIYFNLMSFLNHPLLFSLNYGRYHISASFLKHVKILFLIPKKDPNSRGSNQWVKIVHSYNIQQIIKSSEPY
jgi:hypothetical protein